MEQETRKPIMLDVQRTLRLVTGALFDAESTWRSYLGEANARLQKDANETTARNYSLYQEYEPQLRDFIVQ